MLSRHLIHLVVSVLLSLVGHGINVYLFLTQPPSMTQSLIFVAVCTLILTLDDNLWRSLCIYLTDSTNIILYLRDHRVRLLAQPQ